MNRSSEGWAKRTYSLVVALYPRNFRERYGAAMNLVFQDLLQDPDISAWRLWVSVLRDLPSSFLREHFASLAGGLSTTRQRLPSSALLRHGAVFGCAIVVTWITFRSFHLFGGHEVSPEGWAKVRDFLRLLSPWLLFAPAGYVGARTTGTFGGGIKAGIVAGLIALLTLPGDYLLFHHLVPGGIASTTLTLIAAAAVALLFAACGAGLATLTHRSETNRWVLTGSPHGRTET